VDGKLREVHRASGNALGGTMVDKAYEKFLQDIAGKKRQKLGGSGIIIYNNDNMDSVV
jgi:hypothetical protein